MSHSPADLSSPPPQVHAGAEEVDVWWGSYSPWTMWPSFVSCLLLTILIAWAAGWLVSREWVQATILTFAGVLWLVQILRWAYRIFGYNYRLTTRRLFQDRGLLHPNALRADLTAVAHVVWRHNRVDGLVGVGQVQITLADPALGPLVLRGVRHPAHVAGLIRQAVQKAREEGGHIDPSAP